MFRNKGFFWDGIIMNLDYESEFGNVSEHIFYSEIFMKCFQKSCMDIDSALFKSLLKNCESSSGIGSGIGSGICFHEGSLTSSILEYIDVVLMCGIPGSGKSTWIQKYFSQKFSSTTISSTTISSRTQGKNNKLQNDKEQNQQDYLQHDSIAVEIFSPDSILVDRYNYQWTPERAQEAWAESYQNFGKALLQSVKQKQSYTHESTISDNDQIKKGHKMSKVEKILIWDATFLNTIQRAAILHICRGMNLRIGCVFMDTLLQTCLVRNRKRTRSPVPDEKIKSMHRNLLPPSINEGFDVIFHMKTK